MITTNVLLASILVTQVITTLITTNTNMSVDMIKHCTKQLYLDAGVIRTYTKWLVTNKG